MNKGLMIRNNKLKKKAKKRNEVKEEQKGLCRFIEFKYEVIKKVNGKFKHIGSNLDKGLQIENKVYLLNGKYKFINNKGLKIKQIYEDVPSWANDKLTKQYKKFKNIEN